MKHKVKIRNIYFLECKSKVFVCLSQGERQSRPDNRRKADERESSICRDVEKDPILNKERAAKEK